MTARARYVLALFLLLACDQTVQPEPPKPSVVAVTPSATTLLGVGETMQLTAEVQDQYGKPMPSASVRWTSDTPATATVDDQGVVTAVASGAATITAAVGDVQAMSAFAIGNPDRAALVALYGATNGPNWTSNENWLTDAPLGEWYGVDTDASGRVVKLELNSQLFGTVPAALGYPIPGSLGRLRQLKALGLHDNALTGPIPPELGGLTELNSLNLSNNALTGPIPAELGELRVLARLDLNDNNLTGPIPAELGELPTLDWMVLNNNELTGPIPTELGDLAGVRRLQLTDNALTGPIPPELGNLNSLQVLDLRNNTLTGPIPAELGNLAPLVELVLNYNALTGAIPAELGDLTALQWLEFSHNALTGPIPSQLGSLAALEWLNVSWNEGLSGTLPVTLTRLGNLFSFLASNTEHCAGAGPAFQRWAEALERYWVRQCSAGAAYLVQAAQSLDHPVPLVAGRDAVLRVFPTAPAGTTVPVPLVRASFYDSDSDTAAYQVDIAGKPGPLPVEIDESNTLISANVWIPDSILSPGLEMVVEIDPDGALDSTLAITRRIPETGRLQLDVRQMPALNLTVVPFLWTADPDSVILDQTAAMATDPDGHELLLETRTLLPVGELVVTTRPPVLTSSNDALALLRETAAIWALEGAAAIGSGPPAVRRSSRSASKCPQWRTAAGSRHSSSWSLGGTVGRAIWPASLFPGPAGRRGWMATPTSP